MAKTYGDEIGLLWTKQVYLGRSASKGILRGAKLPDPVNYSPPEYRSILGCRRISLDIETYDPKLLEKGPGVYRQDGYLLGLAIDYGDGDRRYLPLRHSTGTNLNEVEFLRTLKQEALMFSGTLVNANLQYDLDWLNSYGVEFNQCKFFDVQFAEPLLDENKLSYKLDLLGQQYLGVGKFTSKLEEHYGEDFIKHLKDIHPAYVSEYACGDVYLPLEIMDRQVPLLEKEGLTELCNLENQLIPMLLLMRRTGVLVDTDAAQEAKNACDIEALDIGKEMKDLSGFDVDVNSSDTIARAFDSLGIQYPRTKKGAPSFVRKWLENHPSKLANLITQKRSIEKTSGTFLRNYVLNGNINGRIHCMFTPLRSEQGGAVSGRFSSSHPNLQNIPIRHPKLGPMCRKIFIPEQDCEWGRIDWSQIEYRFLVHYAVAAKCKNAQDAADLYSNDKKTDFHEMAAGITKKDREVAKSISFGVAYGMGKKTMADNLGTTVEEGEIVLNEFYKRLPWLKEIYNLASNRASQQGYITTILNRRRRFSRWEKDTYSDNPVHISDNEYQSLLLKDRRGFRRMGTHKALNALLQGSAADLMKKAMVVSYEAGIFSVLSSHLTVHDEIDISKPKTKEGDEAFKELQNIMENTVKLNVPILAKATLGRNWSEAK